MYLTNEVASILGISRTALLYYIDNHVVQPRTDEQTGYRYFSEEDISKLKYCVILRNIGMSVKEIAEYLRECEAEERVDRVRRLAEEMRRKIDEQQMFLRAAEKLIQPYALMKEPEIVQCPVYVYCLTGCETGYHFLTKEKESIQILRNVPVGGFSAIFDETFFDDEPERHYKTGRAIEIGDAQMLGMDTGKMQKMGGCLCVHWRTKSGREKDMRDIRIIQQYMERNRLRMTDAPFCPDISAYRPDANRYMDIYIPVERA